MPSTPQVVPGVQRTRSMRPRARRTGAPASSRVEVAPRAAGESASVASRGQRARPSARRAMRRSPRQRASTARRRSAARRVSSGWPVRCMRIHDLAAAQPSSSGQADDHREGVVIQVARLHVAQRPGGDRPTARAVPLTSTPSITLSSPRFQRLVPKFRTPPAIDVLVEPVEVVLVDEQPVEPAKRAAICGRQFRAASGTGYQRRNDAGERGRSERGRLSDARRTPRARGTPLAIVRPGTSSAGSRWRRRRSRRTRPALTVSQPIAIDGIASAMSGSVTTHGLSCGCSRVCSSMRSSPWKVMKTSRKL